MIPGSPDRRDGCEKGADMLGDNAKNTDQKSDKSSGQTLYELLGGRECLARVHKRLYDKLFAHPILAAFFVNKEQQFQENQQSDFLAAEFGGPSLYRGRLPDGAHQHLFITSEQFELRHGILTETLDECGIEPALRDRWLTIDRNFKPPLVKKTIGQCRKRYGTDHIIVAPNT